MGSKRAAYDQACPDRKSKKMVEFDIGDTVLFQLWLTTGSWKRGFIRAYSAYLTSDIPTMIIKDTDNKYYFFDEHGSHTIDKMLLTRMILTEKTNKWK